MSLTLASLGYLKTALASLARMTGAAVAPIAQRLRAQRQAARGETAPQADLIAARLEQTISGLTGRGIKPTWLVAKSAQLQQQAIDPDAMFRGESLYSWLDASDVRDQLRTLARNRLAGRTHDTTEDACRASLMRRYAELIGDHGTRAAGIIGVLLDVLLAGVTADEGVAASATALRNQAGVETVSERVDLVLAAVGNVSGLVRDQAGTELLTLAATERCQDSLRHILRRRSIPGVDALEEVAALAARVGADGDLRHAASGPKCAVLYWAARLHASAAGRAGAARVFRAALLERDARYDVGIIDAWLEAAAGDAEAGLRQLRHIDTADGRASLMALLKTHQGDEAALDWLDGHATMGPDFLTGPGWYNAAVLSAQAGKWETAVGLIACMTEGHVEECPDLFFVDGVLNAAFLLPGELRHLALLTAPEAVPAQQEGAEVERRRQRALRSFGQAAEALRECGAPARAKGAEYWALWLRLTDRATRAGAEAEIVVAMSAGGTAVDMAPLACAADVAFDPQVLEQYLRRAEAAGGLDPPELAAMLALHRWRKPKADLVRFLDTCQTKLDAVLAPGVHAGLLVAALAEDGQIDRAEAVLAVNRGVLGPDAGRLGDYVRSLRGDDILVSIEQRFAQTGSLIDLMATCELLRKRGNAGRRKAYELELFQRQRTTENARFASSALIGLDCFADALAFLDACDDLVVGDADLTFFKALALFHQAEFARARLLVTGLLRNRGGVNDVALDVNIAIATADWEHLGAVLDHEWPRRHERPPEHLLRLAAVCAEADRDRSVELVRLAVERAPGDVQILLSASNLAVRLGRDDVGLPLIDAAARLSTSEGPVRTMRAEDAIPVMLEGAKRSRDVWTAVSEARVPLLMACSALNTCVTRILVTQARANERATDWRQRSIIPFRHGGRSYQDLGSVRTITADFTSLLVLADLDLLSLATVRFDRIAVPWSTAELLVSEARDCRFHQPSQVAEAKRLWALVTAVPRQIHPRPSGTSSPLPWLVKEVGEELADLLEAARATDGRVVRPLPVSQAGSMLEVEADLREYRRFILQPHRLVQLMREGGVLAREEADRARALLASMGADASADTAGLGAGPLYLDRLAVDRLTAAGLLEHLPELGREVQVPAGLAHEAERLAATEAEEDAALVVLMRLRAWLRDGIASGLVRVLPRPPSTGLDEIRRVPETLSQLVADVGDSDAVLFDDRALGQAVHRMNARQAAVPVVGVIDLLRDLVGRGILDPSRRWAAHHALRRRVFSGIPLDEAEVEHWLGECVPDGSSGKLRETAEVRTIREYFLRLRSTTFLQQSAETLYLGQVGAAAVAAIRQAWRDDGRPVAIAAVQASWLYEHVFPWPPDWQHTVTDAKGLAPLAVGAARLVAALLPPVGVDRGRTAAMADWLERAAIQPLAFASGEVIDLVAAEAKDRIERWSAQREPVEAAAITGLLFQALPGTIRRRVMDDHAFLERHGMGMEVWLSVAGSPQVRRSDLVPAVGRALATGQSQELRGKGGEVVRVEPRATYARLVFAASDGREESSEPDILQLLGHDAATRLEALGRITEGLGPTGPDMAGWSATLRDTPIDEAGLDRILGEMRRAVPMHMAAIHDTLGSCRLEMERLVPTDMAYYEALCGPRPGVADPEAYIGGPLRDHRQMLVDRQPRDGLELCLAMCLRADLSCAPFWQGTRDELWAALDGIDIGAEPFTMLGALDLALHHATEDGRFANLAAELVDYLCRPAFDRGDGVDAYAYLPALVQYADDTVRRQVLGMQEQPAWWRRFCAWTHAALVCRALSTVQFDPAQVADWCRGHESRDGRLARLLELRQVPGRQLTGLTSLHVRSEVLGRLLLLRSRCTDVGIQFPSPEKVDALASALDAEGASGWHLLPGPLEEHQRPGTTMRMHSASFRRRLGREIASLSPNLLDPGWARLAWRSNLVRFSASLGLRCAALVAQTDPGGDAAHPDVEQREGIIGSLARLSMIALVQEWPVLAESTLERAIRSVSPATTHQEAQGLLTVALIAVSALPAADAGGRLASFLTEFCARLPAGSVLQAIHEKIDLIKRLQPVTEWRLSQSDALSG